MTEIKNWYGHEARECLIAGELKIKSLSSDTSIHLNIRNHSDKHLLLKWIDYNGKLVNYQSIKPGQSKY